MPDATFQKAQLVPIDPSTKKARLSDAITVDFNPETLKLSYTVSVKADTASKNSSDQSAQQNSSGSAKLAVELVFDTTDQFEDKQDEADVVKLKTSKIVQAFVAPPQPDNAPAGKPIPANPCLFLWGTFQFIGLVDSYSETLEFFSASGVPLRAAVSISLTESRYKISNIPARTPGVLQPLPQNAPLAPALSSAGSDPSDWRGAALANGMESPRFSATSSIDISAGADFSAAAAAAGGNGFSVGASSNLGTNIPGAFSAGSSVGFGASASVGASFG